MPKPVVLFLAASPQGTTQLDLMDECAAIVRELQTSPGGTSLDLQARWAVTIDDLMRALDALAPALIHFSGHGNAQAIALVGRDGTAAALTPVALAEMIASTGKTARAVVLNACYSEEQASVLAEHLGCAVGMRGSVADEAALQFSVAFYRALGHGRSIYEAFQQARATLVAKGLDQRAAARCLTRADVDASAIRLQRPAEAPAPPPRMAPAAPSFSITNSAGRDNLNSINTGEVRTGDNATISIGLPSRK